MVIFYHKIWQLNNTWNIIVFLICDVIQFVDGDDASNNQNIEPNETNDSLHRNDSHHADNIDDASNLIFLIY